MKKYILLLAIIIAILTPIIGLAAEGSDTDIIPFAWDQPGPLDSLDHWELYQSPTPGGDYELVATIPYTPGQTDFTSEQKLTVNGAAGSAIEMFYVLKAVSKNGNASGPSNEVGYTFNIPWDDVSTPMTFKIMVDTKPID